MTKDYTLIPNLLTEIPQLTPDTIISKTFYTDNQVKMVLFRFAPGQELSEHTASKPAILHFIKGDAKLTLGDDTFEAVEGTWIHMQANLSHSIQAQTEVTLLLSLLEQ
jgi:quercetin dioxygenase-like cupin family protein